jgi:hypothetical protein
MMPFGGVVASAESVSFDLYGCIQVALRPDTIKNEKGEQIYSDGRWFDYARLLILDSKPVMNAPSFERSDDSLRGPARQHLPVKK